MRGHITKRGDHYRVEIHIGYGDEGKRVRHRKTLSTKKAAEKGSIPVFMQPLLGPTMPRKVSAVGWSG